MGRLRVGELVGRVLGAGVVRSGVKGRVRDHQGAVAVAPERAVIAPGETWDEPESRDVLQREARMGAKEPGHAKHHPAGAEIGDEAEEIAAVGVEEPEEGRIALAARLRAVIAKHFQRQHQANVVAAGVRTPGIHHAALLPAQEERRFLIDESDKADGDTWHYGREEPRDFEQGGNAARVVIGARAAAYRVIVGPHDKDLLRPAAAAPRYFEIGTGMARGLIPLERDLIALLAPFRFDVLAGGGQRRGPKDMALADLAGEAFDMVPQALGSHDLRLAHDCLLKTSKRACHRYLRRPPIDTNMSTTWQCR